MSDLKPIFILPLRDEIVARIKSMDNVRAFHKLDAHISLTEPLKYLRRFDNASWLFEWLVSDLEDDSEYIQNLNITITHGGGVAEVKSICDHGAFRSCATVAPADFPLDRIALRAVCEGNFWHVSLITDSLDESYWHDVHSVANKGC